MSEYIMNMETQKLELHFEKADYMALSEELKKEIKSNFLFSRKAGAWVSRTKFPNLWYAETVAKKIGLTDGGKSGETLTFAEQMERKTKKAEARAERYDHKSEHARDKAVALQKPINDMHGDVAFFTQPNINSSSGRAFTNRRNRMFAAWERGFDEFKKSEYYAERAEAARRTAAETKPTDKGFIFRRIKEAEKTIRAQKNNLESYRKTLEQIKQGKTFKHYNGTPITADTVQKWIEDAELIIENAISKSLYYHECLEEVGAVAFSKVQKEPVMANPKVFISGSAFLPAYGVRPLQSVPQRLLEKTVQAGKVHPPQKGGTVPPPAGQCRRERWQAPAAGCQGLGGKGALPPIPPQARC